MGKKFKNNLKGFTIIEVTIVLAIAAVIMVIVFAAVPALQRNTRNTQRTSDASLIATAVNECLTNNNQVVTGNCDTAARINAFLDTTKLKQVTSIANVVNTAATTGVIPAGTTTANVYFYNSCTNSGGAAQQSTSATSFVVLYNNETTGGTAGRCVSGG